MAPSRRRAAGIEIDGDRFHSIGMGAEYSGTVEIDDTAKPKHFDLIFAQGPESGNRNRGIYQLKGNTWKLCLDTTGKSRPSVFRTAPGSGYALEVFTRGAARETSRMPRDAQPRMKRAANLRANGRWWRRSRKGTRSMPRW